MMRVLKPHEIKLEQLKLLQTCGHSLAEYAEPKEQHEKSLKSKNKPLFKSIDKLQIKWTKNTGKNINSNLQAFLHVILHRIYSVRVEQSLLALLKSAFYNCELELVNIGEKSRWELSSQQMKKLVVEFFYMLGYSFFDDKIQANLTKYPIITHIFVLFFRKLLSQMQVGQALNWEIELPTEKIYYLLSNFFKINLQVEQNIYRFHQVAMVIACSQQSQYHVGSFKTLQNHNFQASLVEKYKQNTTHPSSKMDQSPSKTSIKCFLPKKSMKNKHEQLKESAQTYSSLKDICAKKSKSLKDYPKTKQNNIKSQQLKAVSTCCLTLPSKKSCDCLGKKRKKMSLVSNIYQFNIIQTHQGNHLYTNSKGFSCELYQTIKPQHISNKPCFQYKKRFQTQNLAQLKAKNTQISTNMQLNTNNVTMKRPISQYEHPSIPFHHQKKTSSHQIKPMGPYSKPVPSFLLKSKSGHNGLKNKNSALNGEGK